MLLKVGTVLYIDSLVIYCLSLLSFKISDFSESYCLVGLLTEEWHVFFDSWLVYLVADHLEDFSEGLLVSLASLSLSKFKIDFCQVHSDGSRGEGFEKFRNEVNAEPIAFSCACGFELFSINRVNIEWHPVFTLVLIASMWNIISIHHSVDFVHFLRSAVFWLEN